MNRRNLTVVVLALCAGVMATGCMPKLTIEDVKAMKPQRPAELDRLNAFVGKWQSEGEAKMTGLDQVLKVTGTSEAKWGDERWFVVSNEKMVMAELGDMEGIGASTYDTKAKVYRSTWVDSMGGVGTGTSSYDEKTNTWHMKGSSYSPWGKSTFKGQFKFLDDANAEWTWTEYGMGGLTKTMEITGTSKRL